MHRSFIVVILLLGCVAHASAQEPYALDRDKQTWIAVKARPELPSLFEPDSKLRLVGVVLSVGLPGGIAGGVSIHPWTNLVRVELCLSGALSFGFHAGATLDPFDWVVAPTLTLSGGYFGRADFPSATQPTRFETVYLSIQPGIEVGRRSRFRLFLRAGYSHAWFDTDYRPRLSGNQATSATKIQVNLLPSLSLGVSAYF
jgi:hypothetical protein